MTPTPEALAAAWSLNPSVIMTAEGVEQIARAMDEFAAAQNEPPIPWISNDDHLAIVAREQQESSRLRAERDRLRGALEKITQVPIISAASAVSWYQAYCDIQRQANAALSPELGAPTDNDAEKLTDQLKFNGQCQDCPHPAHQGRCSVLSKYDTDGCGCTHGAKSAPQSESAAPREERESKWSDYVKSDAGQLEYARDELAATRAELAQAREELTETQKDRDCEYQLRVIAEKNGRCPCCLGQKQVRGVPCEECKGTGLAAMAYETARAAHKRVAEALFARPTRELEIFALRTNAAESELVALKREVAAVLEPFAESTKKARNMQARMKESGQYWTPADYLIDNYPESVEAAAALHAKVTEG